MESLPGSINLRIDDELKARSYAALEKMGVTPSEALRLMLEYIADNERLPFKQTLLSDEDAELVEIVKERLRNPKPVRVTLDEL
ncbi:type II toxin-antitoxin system antitoxin RelB [Escherichia coli]|nr:type II toxin-antitoxin system antitoxin RelB [Escherichia coli]ELC88509.1 antitoxin RelB [Escherichia coli KTE193]ELI29307.1 antitoxin RelB [Escherichia coli KTE112]